MGSDLLWKCGWALGLGAIIAVGGAALAQEAAREGCIDARGRPVREVEDPLLVLPARADRDGDAALLRVNPLAMTSAPPRVRLFYLARECARHALGEALGAIQTPEQSRRADCWALTALHASGELDAPGAVRALQAELDLAAQRWQQVAGVRREVDLQSCLHSGVLRLPLDGAPSRAQQGSNRCIHGCGDRLWQCQKSCTHVACRAQCEIAFDACESRCPGR